jgi:alpha 1,2-mannosyltransferase
LGTRNTMEFIFGKINQNHTSRSNFEIGDLRWFRSKEYNDYFDYLDKAGGFFYERWGDAPVHSIAVGLLLNQDELHYFGDIGYRHMDRLTCPIDGKNPHHLQCNCNLQSTVDQERWTYRDHWSIAVQSYFFSWTRLQNESN